MLSPGGRGGGGHGGGGDSPGLEGHGGGFDGGSCDDGGCDGGCDDGFDGGGFDGGSCDGDGGGARWRLLAFFGTLRGSVGRRAGSLSVVTMRSVETSTLLVEASTLGETSAIERTAQRSALHRMIWMGYRQHACRACTTYPLGG